MADIQETPPHTAFEYVIESVELKKNGTQINLPLIPNCEQKIDDKKIRLFNSEITIEEFREIRYNHALENLGGKDSLVGKVYMYLYDKEPDIEEIDIFDFKELTDDWQSSMAMTIGSFTQPWNHYPRIQLAVDFNDPKKMTLFKEYRLDTFRGSALRLTDNKDADIFKHNPELLKLFVFLHELGHARDFMELREVYTNPEVIFKQLRDEELASLPLAKDPNEAREWRKKANAIEFYTNNQALFSEYKTQDISIDTILDKMDELVEKNNVEYRNLPTEKFADNFAVETMFELKKKGIISF